MRFFVRRVSGTGNLTVKGTLAGGALQLTAIATVNGTAAWQPSPIVAFPPALTTAVATGGLNAQFQFVADPGTVYRIDDVYMDPFKSR
jgi:mannose/fructose/N-acetylgalactosamine-specific phosphotransferase system component IIC